MKTAKTIDRLTLLVAVKDQLDKGKITLTHGLGPVAALQNMPVVDKILLLILFEDASGRIFVSSAIGEHVLDKAHRWAQF